MRVRFLTPAQIDLLRAVQYYEDESPLLAVGFLAEVDHANALIRDFPRLGVPAARGTRRFKLHRFPYSLIYQIGHDDVVRVFAVQHHSRDSRSWESRL